MAIKNIIARGIGFSPGSISFIPTLGFTPGPAVVQVFGALCAALSVFPATAASLSADTAAGAGLSVGPATGGTISAIACEDD